MKKKDVITDWYKRGVLLDSIAAFNLKTNLILRIWLKSGEEIDLRYSVHSDTAKAYKALLGRFNNINE